MALPGISYYLSRRRYFIHICKVRKELNRQRQTEIKTGTNRNRHIDRGERGKKGSVCETETERERGRERESE